MIDKITTPIGEFYFTFTEDFVTQTYFEDNINTSINTTETNLSKIVKNQVKEYFNGTRKKFDLPLQISGTDFQKSVWQQLLNIPYGKTCSYKDIAISINNEKAVRAVGGANNKNKIGLIIPCHRVIGSNNKLIGYAGGLWRKKYLLELEKRYL